MTRVSLKEHVPLFNHITHRITRLRLICMAALLLSCISLGARAQKVGLKTNLLYDATGTVNGGIEIALAPRWTLDVSGNLCAWDMGSGKKWKHWLAQPEARYWLCERFSGHFLALHGLGGQYNIGGFNGHYNLLGTDLRKLKESRYQGWMAGAGVAYGYTWILSRHWNMEGEIGVGYAYGRYDRYECQGCGRKVDSGRKHNYVGPTKAAINMVYVF